MAIIKAQKTDKQYLLDRTEDGFSFYEFVLDELKMADQNRCENICNPFYNDKKPAFSIYYAYDMWRFHDYGDSSYSGDVFSFAAFHYGLDVNTNFKEILLNMYRDLNIPLPEIELEVNDEIVDLGFQLPGLVFNDLDGLNLAHEYYKQFGISKRVLKKYHVRAISTGFCYIARNGELRQWRVGKDQVTIVYEDINHFKLYRPGADQYKFQYYGNKPFDFVFGQKQIIRDMIRTKRWERDLLIIAAGEKDVMVLTELGYDAICFNSETVTNIPKQLEDSILMCYKKIIVLYDRDQTGKRSAIALYHKYGFETCELPNELIEKGGKDVSDYVKLGLDIDTLHNLINEAANAVSEEEGLIEINDVIVNSDIDERPLTIENSKDLHSEELIKTETDNIENIASSQKNSTLLPDDIYTKLPEPLKSICEQFTDLRERDIVFLSSLVMASTLFPSLKSVNNRKVLGANLSLFITAPAASGKGVADWGRYCGRAIQRQLKEQYEYELKKFKEKGVSKKQEENDSESDEIVKPIRKSLFIPANASTSKIIEMLGANKNFGIIFETEGDTLAEALKTEWGNFSNIIRCCFHHETLSLARRGNDEFIEVDDPHLSILLTGTPKQVSSLIDSVENGFFSRLIFYDFECTPIWRSQLAKNDTPPLDIFFEGIADQYYNMWVRHENANKTFVKFSNDQIDRIDAFFKSKQQSLLTIYGTDIIASVNRSAVVCQRIAMILTALRHLESNKLLPEKLPVSEQDLYISLSIINTLLGHLQTIFARMQNDVTGSKLNFQQRRVWDVLPPEFTRKNYDAAVSILSIAYKTGEKYINDFLQKELLIRIKQGIYQKTV